MDTIPTVPEVTPVVVPVKRGRGRPKGSLGKKKRETIADAVQKAEVPTTGDTREE